MTLRIGLDLDNTIINYDRAFAAAAKERDIIPASFSGNKQKMSDHIRLLPDGETEWQRLQGYVYGKGIMQAELFAGVTAFLEQAKAAKAILHIVSHKTQHGHFDPDKVDLREAARKFLQTKGVFDFISPGNVSFHTTRGEKIQKLSELGCEIFVDDLEEVLGDPDFPATTRKLLFAPEMPHAAQNFELCKNWAEVAKAVFAKDVNRIASDLLKAEPDSVTLAGGGGNSRIYRVEAKGKSYALKMYPPGDTRDRLGVEKKTLQFFERHGIANTPRWLGDTPGHALLTWAEGTLAIPPTDEEIQQAAAFIGEIKRLNAQPDSKDFPPAAEACTSGAEIVRQIERRLIRLNEVATTEPSLRLFLENEFLPALRNAQGVAETGKPLAKSQLCLIPADFGFHNTLRGADGLTFIDFEYFGWDDPVKLTADFLLHPAMSLNEKQKELFASEAKRIFSDDPDFALRLRVLTPLFALRWALILLNEFLPERWSGRAFARGENGWEVAKKRQLEKAQNMLKFATKETANA